MLKRICKITFITHGATVYSIDGIINDKLNLPKINEYGEFEIEHVCEYLKKRGVSYDRIYSSPAMYCKQSANIIAKMFHKKVDTLDLPGRNHGELQGLFYADLFNENGASVIAKTPKNGESVKKFNSRVSKLIKKLIIENKGNRIIIVTTPDVVQSAIAQALELTPENQYKTLIKTGSLTQISYFEGWSSIIYSDYKPL